MSSSWARSRRAQNDDPARVAAATIRTSCRSGCSEAYAAAEAASSGSSASTSGGRTKRSTSAAQPCTVSGQLIAASCSSSDWPGTRPSCSIAVRASSPRLPASCGSRATSSVVSTRANSRAGWSQPAAAACRSISSTAAASPCSPTPAWPGTEPVMRSPPSARTTGASASWSAVQALISAIALARVAALASRIEPLSPPSASAQLAGGTRNSWAPSCRAPAIFCWMPPICADLAVGGDRAGPGDDIAVGQRPRRERVVDRRREHQAGARAADGVGDVDRDVEGELVAGLQGDPDQAVALLRHRRHAAR